MSDPDRGGAGVLGEEFGETFQGVGLAGEGIGHEVEGEEVRRGVGVVEVDADAEGDGEEGVHGGFEPGFVSAGFAGLSGVPGVLDVPAGVGGGFAGDGFLDDAGFDPGGLDGGGFDIQDDEAGFGRSGRSGRHGRSGLIEGCGVHGFVSFRVWFCSDWTGAIKDLTSRMSKAGLSFA